MERWSRRSKWHFHFPIPPIPPKSTKSETLAAGDFFPIARSPIALRPLRTAVQLQQRVGEKLHCLLRFLLGQDSPPAVLFVGAPHFFLPFSRDGSSYSSLIVSGERRFSPPAEQSLCCSVRRRPSFSGDPLLLSDHLAHCLLFSSGMEGLDRLLVAVENIAI